MKVGAAQRGQKILKQVIDELKKRAEQDPSERACWVDALARLDPDQAAKIANSEVASAQRPCDWSLIAYTLQNKQKRKQAAAIADAILKRQPKCEHAWLVKGHVADTGLKSWQAVLDVANAALKHLPKSLPLMNLKAGALHSGWKNKEAAEVWEEIARRDLNFPGVMGMLATAWTQLPEIEDADFLKPLEQRLKSKPDDVILRYIIGTASYYRDDFQSVIKYLDPLRKVVPREPRVHLYTAMAHFHLGHTKTAFERLNTLQTFGHGDPDFYYCRSVMTRHTDFEGSLRDLETFVRLSQNRLNSDAKIYKMNRELEVMRSGRVPTKFDLLPPFARWGIILGILALLIGGAVTLWRRRRG
ncbi:MAG TPA: hypothetical protein DCQ06_05035 [Myxococcales bacterium]|nr:hypothetical protein [Myxococcales bacterium]